MKNDKLFSDISFKDNQENPIKTENKNAQNFLLNRGNALSEMARGERQQKTHYFVDPSKCKMWRGHNRLYSALTYENCSDLIESIKSQGRQEVPAIVRRLKDDPDGYEYEVICGARRHWSVSWLNENNYANIKFLVEPNELTDEEAFRISDLENRARRDISDLERSKDYEKALNSYYSGTQKEMARRLNVTETWLSRYLDLGKIPEQVINAFSDPLEIKIAHAIKLKKFMKDENSRKCILSKAQEITAERQKNPDFLKSVNDVLKELILSTDIDQKSKSLKKIIHQIGDQNYTLMNGKEAFRVDRLTRKKITITFMLPDITNDSVRNETMELLKKCLENNA